ncbi:AmmeMemoRadiSam system protein A [Patescibacteria group bacterium]|nr:AmmeMemoRadiSam system protein A [Patescibacteria group bacterium]
MNFNDSEKRELLAFARRVLEKIVKEGDKLEEECLDSHFMQTAGVYVFLYQNNETVGFAGYVIPTVSIWDAIAENVISAGTHNLGKSDILPEDLAGIKIEIAILSVPKECSFEEIEENKDGVIVEQGRYKATFPPQFWKEFPAKEEFLTNLCEKAKIEPDAWKNFSTKLYKYGAIIFNE